MQFRREAHISGKTRKRVLSVPTAECSSPRAAARPSLHRQTTDRVRVLIVEGDYEPGERLVEADLCRQLRVSRTPLREALKVLAGEGLVDLEPNRGASVARMSAGEIRDLFVVIAHLESLAADICCTTISADDLVRLEGMHRKMLEWRAQGRRHDYFEINDRIHRAIVAIAGNSILAETHQRLIARARRVRYQALLTSGRWDQSIAEHSALMQALTKRQGKSAARIWRRHVMATGELVAGQIGVGVTDADEGA